MSEILVDMNHISVRATVMLRSIDVSRRIETISSGGAGSLYSCIRGTCLKRLINAHTNVDLGGGLVYHLVSVVLTIDT